MILPLLNEYQQDQMQVLKIVYRKLSLHALSLHHPLPTKSFHNMAQHVAFPCACSSHFCCVSHCLLFCGFLRQIESKWGFWQQPVLTLK